jgi:hypothetical protein
MHKNRRPTGVTLLALFVLGLALWNGLRLEKAIVFWSILKEYQTKPGPLYAAISGGIWLLTGLSIVWGLWQGKNWAWFSALIGAGGYGSWYWFDRLVLQEPHSNWSFALAFTILLAGFFTFILLNPKSRAYFSRQGKIMNNFLLATFWRCE